MNLLTARLRLDALQAHDAPALFKYRSDETVARFQGWRPADVAEADAFIARQVGTSLETTGRWFQRAIRLRDGGELVGDLGIQLPAEAWQSIEFGISIAPAWQRRGHAGEALRALFSLVFEQMGRHRMHASVDPQNRASLALLRTVGMRQEAHHVESLFLDGEWVDDVIFALLSREWNARKPSA